MKSDLWDSTVHKVHGICDRWVYVISEYILNASEEVVGLMYLLE